MELNEQLHFAVLPWLAAGHLIPFVELSTRLSLLGHRVSFLSTPANLLRLPSGLPPLLRPVPLVPSRSFGVSGSCTLDISNRPDSDSLRVQLRRTMDSLADPLSVFLRSASPPVDWLLCDYVSYWAPALAKSSGARSAYVSIFNATVGCFFGPTDVFAGRLPRSVDDFTSRPPWVPFPTSVAFTPREALKVFAQAMVADDDDDDPTGVSEGYRVSKTIEHCDIVAVRSCVELEPEWLELLPEIFKKTVVPLGHFPPMRRDCMKNGDGDWASAIEWLDEQSVGSVVYVAFGSEVRLSEQETGEIARGLELSGLPFVWASRIDAAGGGSSESRVVGRGIVCRGWVPQGRFLGHPAVGGFLTHCGWNSLVEAMSLGRSLILMPMMYDQPLNARMVAEKGAGKEVPRGDDGDVTFDAVGIAETLRLVMVDEAGETYRARARELKSVLGDEGVQDSYIVRFVQHMKDHRPTRKDTIGIIDSADRVDMRGDA